MDEFFVTPGATVMDDPGQKILAGAGLATDEDRVGAGGGLAHVFLQPANGRRATHEAAKIPLLAE